MWNNDNFRPTTDAQRDDMAFDEVAQSVEQLILDSPTLGVALERIARLASGLLRIGSCMDFSGQDNNLLKNFSSDIYSGRLGVGHAIGAMWALYCGSSAVCYRREYLDAK